MQTELFGITFRSISHMHWFIGTMSAFILCILLNVFLLVPKRWYHVAGLVWFEFGYVEASICLKAYIETHGGQINNEMYSVDCIWYNRMLSIIGFTLLLLCLVQWRRSKKSKPTT